jgi:pyridoxal phosphate enzyme (YggS family)
MIDHASRLQQIRSEITDACERAKREPCDVTLVAVSKGQSIDAMRTLYDLGVRDFGESYVQEWQAKVDQLPDDVRWHFIGHLQSNKAKYIADRIALVHSVDRKSVMKELNKRSSKTCEVLLQVNVGEDPNKSGVDPDATVKLLQKALNYDHLRVRGLMTIPPFTDDLERTRGFFRELHEQFELARAWLQAEAVDHLTHFTDLSMGMSADYAIAVEEGATIVRVGTALFGPRSD